jgi:hypothetical protein
MNLPEAKHPKYKLVPALTPATSGTIQLLESGLMNLTVDGNLIMTIDQNKARKLAIAILVALDEAEGTVKANSLPPAFASGQILVGMPALKWL